MAKRKDTRTVADRGSKKKNWLFKIRDKKKFVSPIKGGNGLCAYLAGGLRNSRRTGRYQVVYAQFHIRKRKTAVKMVFGQDIEFIESKGSQKADAEWVRSKYQSWSKGDLNYRDKGGGKRKRQEAIETDVPVATSYNDGAMQSVAVGAEVLTDDALIAAFLEESDDDLE